MVDHPDYDRLLSAMARLALTARPYRGILYRACTPVYANTRDLLTGHGALKSGGRWNTPRRFPLVYLAQSLECAIAETMGVAGHYGFAPAARLPLTIVAVDVMLKSTIDLTDAAVRKHLGVTLRLMMTCDWRSENAAGREALTQALGRAALGVGFQGIIVPSALKRSFRNLNLFPKNLGKSATLTIRKADKLPPPPPPGV